MSWVSASHYLKKMPLSDGHHKTQEPEEVDQQKGVIDAFSTDTDNDRRCG